MSDDPFQLYNDVLLSYVAQVSVEHRLTGADIHAKAVSPVCGSEVEIFLDVNDNVIDDIGYTIEACALTKTVLAIFLKNAVGLTRADIEKVAHTFEKWLARETDELPAGWGELDMLSPARDYTARHDSMMLPFTATLKALDKTA